MSQLFISHAEEDQEVAVEIGNSLEQRGFSVWYYERDGVPGVDYLDQMVEAIEQCEALVLLISEHALSSRPVNAEVVRAFEANKPFVPLLYRISRNIFHAQKPGWRMALGAATSIEIPPAGLPPIMGKIEAGVKKLGIKSISSAKPIIPSTILPKPEDAIQCTLFAPEIITGGSSLFHAWLHTVGQADDVMRISQEFDGEARRRAWQVIDESISPGTQVRLDLKAGRLPVKSLSTALTWQGQPEAIVFRVESPENLAPSLEVGEITLYHEDGIQLASLKFKIEITDRIESVGKGEVSHSATPSVVKYRKAYLCYAYQDRVEVLRRAQMLRLAGIEFFMDLTDLTSVQNWQEQIYHQIDQADLFVLFWSNAAKHSDFVERQWRYALKSKGPGFIQPIAIEVPLPEPPPELLAIHFNTSLAYFALAAESEAGASKPIDSD